jgi:hypothetical protein
MKSIRLHYGPPLVRPRPSRRFARQFGSAVVTVGPTVFFRGFRCFTLCPFLFLHFAFLLRRLRSRARRRPQRGFLFFDQRQLAVLGNRCTANGFGKLASGVGPIFLTCCSRSPPRPITSPMWIPMRKLMRLSMGRLAIASVRAACASTAHCTASTALSNSARTLSPAVFAMRPVHGSIFDIWSAADGGPEGRPKSLSLLALGECNHDGGSIFVCDFN